MRNPRKKSPCKIFAAVALLSLLTASAFYCQDAFGQARFQRLRELIRQRLAQKQSQGNQGASQPGLEQKMIECSGVARTYFVHAPASLRQDTTVPMVLVFHGGGGTAVGMAKMTNMTQLSDSKGFVVVYPQGMEKQWNDGRKGAKINCRAKYDDVAFVSQLIDTVEKEYPIDRSRIYACGISNGGFFSQRLICQLPDKIAAAASVVASMPADGACVPSQPVPIMFMLGTKDPLIPFLGGPVQIPFAKGDRGAVKSASDTATYWLQFDGCPKMPQTEKAFDGHDGTTLQYKSFAPGKANSELVFCAVQGGGHCWPGGKQYLPASIVGKASSVDGNALILDFFQRHRL